MERTRKKFKNINSVIINALFNCFVIQLIIEIQLFHVIMSWTHNSQNTQICIFINLVAIIRDNNIFHVSRKVFLKFFIYLSSLDIILSKKLNINLQRENLYI